MRTAFNDQQETLVTLAADTGGKALLDNNDLALGIAQAQKDISSYYILGYYSSNAVKDGKFRRIRVKLNPGLRARLSYRPGYFASKEFKDFNGSDKERQLEEALVSGDPVTELPLALEVNYFRLGKSTYFVPVAVKIPGWTMELASHRNTGEAELDFIGQVRDSSGRVVGSVRDGIKVKLKGVAAKTLTEKSLEYDSGFTLGPGNYSLKFLARENVTGKIGTFETSFSVPDLGARSALLRTSSVVWSSQREPLSEAVASAEKNRKLLASHPLIQDGYKLIPSITRVYRRDQNLYVYLEAYDAAVTPDSAPDIMASVSFFRGGSKVFQTQPVRITNASAKSRQTVPVRFEVPLKDIRPGRYVCQVNLVDEVGRKFAFSRAPMVVIR